MEPDVIRMYSSSPPPMEDEDEDDEFGDFGGFSGVPNSVSFTEFDTPATFNQNQTLNATSPPELLNNGGVVGISNLSPGPTSRAPADDPPRPNGVVPGGDGRPPDRTVNSEEPRKHVDRSRPRRRSNSPTPSGSVQTCGESVDCNGGGGSDEVLTNGFATFEVRGSSPSPSSSPQNSVRSHQTGATAERTADRPTGPPDDDDFADFAAFSNADIQGHPGPPATDLGGDSDNSVGGNWPTEESACRQHSNTEQGSDSEDDVRDAPDGQSNGDEGVRADGSSTTSEKRDTAHEHSAAKAACTKGPVGQNGTDSEGSEEGGGGGGVVSTNADEKGSGTETETETETSLGRPLSTDALEEYGDASTTGSAPSPPLQEETATPADHSQLAEEEEEDDGDFGDFGDAGSFGGQGFADFEQPEMQERGGSTAPAQEMADDEEFGDFDAPPTRHAGVAEAEGGEGFADFPSSDSFADFSSADAGADAGWNAFDEPGRGQAEADSWAAFGEEQSVAPPEDSEDEWREGGGMATAAAPPPASDDAGRRDSLSASLSGRLEKLFQATFPENPVPQLGEQVLSLKTLLEPPERPQRGEDEEAGAPDDGGLRDVWRQLQDVHDAFGLRHQWGGSHSNKTLLCSLGIDTRNILYTGQKKQPVIVPMYAASLGMLEPTKEPVKPISAAEMITSIAQAPPVALEITCPSGTAQQETLPPVQFDWSSSGLTNPLDASGGSSLLNLDFFGPVEDSGSGSSTSIPGVDPELFELTTSKLDPSGPGSRVADAFARLMSTMEKTSTSTRKPRKEENLSEEALEVIAGLPDLSFMQAKVLMFPATLTPLGRADPTPD